MSAPPAGAGVATSRPWRLVAWVVVILIATALLVGLVNSQARRGYLDPEAIDAAGARAVVRLLEGHGVAVTEVRTTSAAVEAAAPGTTVFVTVPDLLRPEQAQSLAATGADLVLAGPGSIASEFSERITPLDGIPPDSLDPGCDLAEAVRAGSARLGGVLYAVDAPALGCYTDRGDAALVADTLDGGARLIVLGAPDPALNRYLDEDGNAALVLGLLGHHPELVWYRPTLEELEGAPAASMADLLPGWVVPVVWQLGIAGLLVAVWRGRRLGRVVTEPLPVVVRATETTEGQARLYRRSRARDHAAATLREAAANRLRSRLGVPGDASSAALARAVAAHAGRPETEVSALLAGPPPPDDASLVRLADDLDTIEQEVRSL